MGMLRFVAVGQRLPEKRAAAERRGDFAEIYGPYRQEAAAEQAARCSQCGVPFCQVHCPLHNNIPDWLKLTAEGRLEEAYELAQATNTFPEICGRICPQDRLCEGNCVIEKGFESVTIGAVERHITDTAWAEGWVKPPRPPRERPQHIGIVGAGPAGLAAADALRRRGYRVTVYDRHDRVGGLLVYGIPNFKLDKAIVRRRAEQLAAGGVAFRLNFELGRDASLAELRARHDALLLATGVYQARELDGVPGAGARNVVAAMDYLTASNRVGLGDQVPAFADGSLDARGRHVVVIGGGDTAMDCVRTAVRQGAASVKCLYRRDRRNMPGSQREVRHAEEEGVTFEWLAAPLELVGRAEGPRKRRLKPVADLVASVRAARMRLGVADASGRQAPEPVPGAGFELPADLAIKALGYDAGDLRGQFAAPDLPVAPAGTVAVERRSLMTSLDGVFAAGDVVRGASLVVWAIRDGRDAADSIHRYVQSRAALPAAAE